MKIVEATERTPELIDRLLEVWEGSVRATHLFLSEHEIAKIKKVCAAGAEGDPPFDPCRR